METKCKSSHLPYQKLDSLTQKYPRQLSSQTASFASDGSQVRYSIFERRFLVKFSHDLLNSQIFFASSIKLLSCCSSSSWGNRVPFEHGWSYRKNSNAGKFVFPYWFIHKNFRLVRGPVFCPVSGFCTSDGHIKKILM